MKAKCLLFVEFRHNGNLKFSVDVEGEVSVPCLIEEIALTTEEGDELFTIRTIDYEVKKGVWKPVIILNTRILESETELPWDAIKEDIDDTFLPGYTFCWDKYTKKPTDWTPPGFDTLFNVED